MNIYVIFITFIILHNKAAVPEAAPVAAPASEAFHINLKTVGGNT